MPKPIHPLAEWFLRGAVNTGAKALGRAMESVLEDLGAAADNVSARTKRGRERLGDVGVGRPKPKPRGRRARRDEEDE
jgi:hypothetical protein